ncbi:hypothetical protein A1F97_07526 [Pyrenophora tritici-repentis]|uniref:Uncharacterized protein n=2 Tax=Pyrenophora tritici-repentis TaxID=45151 RepID=B2W4L3_PYRTR|nr:uncharacterized protein PTRG_04563 [Pyrenophora tritici-repentis Pt-1C-BFP]EDU47470.1 predicted protein [Pyrenophora tritici-repentis Pt-1C-BFP]KAI1528486.1 hypothetical protein PtrSN001C_009457 [Pyrenophora tritici-repentis]KAI1596585.1 hypothetical protein PtrCC142_009533 [Pyrenophora tritici-repentis]PZD37515.1 hypothetical protein A1F97_07526 [Pyrenophora tritici-repentis]
MKGFVEREKVRQAEQEEQAKEAREKLENLYSSEYIDIYTSQPDQDLDDTEWDDGVGTLRLGKRLPQYNFGIGKGMMGAVLDIFGGPEEATAINMKRPKYASLDAVKVSFYDDGEAEKFTTKLTFLRNGLLELVISNRQMRSTVSTSSAYTTKI